ncbi:MAG: septum formation protein Maf [Gammaproteobacteria bacterium]|nr:septum formation protein Maf [Gammaproteobacteria bacterium]|tara:strand:- start:34279 stop:34866 length:588 start_codon:yes stop_codon:yes gene_type:complete
MRKQIILASSSIHRKKLLNQLKIQFEIVRPNINETRHNNENINSYVRRLSFEKAQSVAKKYKKALVIGSDEVAVVNKKVLGKPLTKKNAIKQLKYLSNKIVTFKTGLCVMDSDSMKKYTSVANFKIYMRKITEKEIINYINKEDMLNCAGSIRIEGLAIAFVKKMHGIDPSSIVGLPVLKLIEFLKRFNYNILTK